MQLLKEFRTRHSKLCHFGTLMILNRRHLRNSRCGKSTLISPVSSSDQAFEFPLRKVPSLYREEKSVRFTEDWELMLKWSCANSPTQITLVFHQFLPVYFLVTFSQFTVLSPSPLFSSHPCSYWSLGKKAYEFWGLTAYSGHFPFEDSHVRVNIVNQMCMLLKKFFLLYSIKNWTEGRGKEQYSIQHYFSGWAVNSGPFPIAQLVKNPPAMQETLVKFLGREDPLEKGQATHSHILGLSWWLRQ